MWSQDIPCKSPEAIFRVSVHGKEPSLDLTILVETRNLGEVAWTHLDSKPCSGVGLHSLSVSELQDEVRYSVKESGDGTCRLEIHKPQWIRPPLTRDGPATPEAAQPPPKKDRPSDDSAEEKV
jgi:hypothetical protein